MASLFDQDKVRTASNASKEDNSSIPQDTDQTTDKRLPPPGTGGTEYGGKKNGRKVTVNAEARANSKKMFSDALPELSDIVIKVATGQMTVDRIQADMLKLAMDQGQGGKLPQQAKPKEQTGIKRGIGIAIGGGFMGNADAIKQAGQHGNPDQQIPRPS